MGENADNLAYAMQFFFACLGCFIPMYVILHVSITALMIQTIEDIFTKSA